MENRLVLDTPIGNMLLREQDGMLLEIRFMQTKACSLEPVTDSGSLLGKLARQIQDYFQGRSFSFDGQAVFPGTDFQQRVWRALQQIPVGQTRSYGEVARQLHSSARAVGNACRRNPFPIIVPCHRVVAANGIGGFAGQTQGHNIDIKNWLLRHEREAACKRVKYASAQEKACQTG